jgi:hypothetical protein
MFDSLPRSAIILSAIGAFVCLDLVSRYRGRPAHYAYGVLLGSLVGVGLIVALQSLFGSAVRGNGFVMAVGVLFTVLVWRLLFGNWEARTKATVLGTVIFWIFFNMLLSETSQERSAHLLAIGFAIIPAVVWCLLFLPYHRERLSVVLTMFFAGMLSTVPILFYDALARRGVQMNFFLFRIVPENFSSSAQTFVMGQWPTLPQLHVTLFSMFLSFFIVGLIEEGSKLWFLKKVGTPLVRSIDDVVQLGIVVAIGFAFAENVTNSGYFLGFVREYLFNASKPDWVGFLGNVAGRSILTSMVHIVSTGICAYFFGLAIFADPVLRNSRAHGWRFPFIEELHDILGANRKDLFRREMMLIGFTLSSALHAFSNILVSLPDVLPGNPRTLGDILGSPSGSPLHLVALLVFPTLLYVGGGYLVLTALLGNRVNRAEHGRLIVADTFVTRESEV